MKRRTRALIWAGAIVVLVASLVVVGVRTQSERLAGTIAGVVNARFAADRNISIEAADIGGNLFREIRAKDLRVIYTGGPEPRVLLAASGVYLRYSLAALIAGRIDIDSLSIVSGRLVLARKPDGTFVNPGGDAPLRAPDAPVGGGMDVAIRRIDLADVSVVIETAKPWILKSESVRASFRRHGDLSTLTITKADIGVGDAARIETFTGEVAASADRVELRDLSVRTASSGLAVAGVLGTGANDSLDLEARIDSLDIAEVPVFLGKPRLAEPGSLRGRIAVSGRYKDLDLTAALRGCFDMYTLDSLAVRGAYRGTSLSVDELDCAVNGCGLAASGEITFGDAPAYDGAVRFVNLDLARMVKDGKEAHSSALAGSLHFSGRGLARQDLALTVWLDLGQGRYRDWGFDSVGGRISLTGDEVGLDSLVARVAATTASATGKFGFDGAGDLKLDLDCPRLEDLYAYHKVKDLGGEVRGEVALEVARGDLGIKATSLGRGIDYAGAYLESLQVDVDLSRMAGHWRGSGGLFGSTVNIRGFKAGELYGDVVVEDTTLTVQRLAVTRPGGDLVGARGEVTFGDKQVRITIDGLMIEIADYLWHNRDPVEIVYAADSLAVSSFEMASEMGMVSFANSAFAGGRFRVHMQVDDLDLGLVKQLVGKEMPTGLLALTLDVTVAGDDLGFDLAFRVGRGEMRAVKFEALEGSIGYTRGTLEIRKVSLEENGGSVLVQGSVPLDLTPSRLTALSKAGRMAEVVDDLGQVTVKASAMDISVLWPVAPPLTKIKGLADLDLVLSGRRDNPKVETRGRVGGAYYGGTAMGDVSWDVVLQDSSLEVASLDVARGSEKVKLAGYIPLAVSLFPFSSVFPDKPMDLSVVATNGALDLLCEVFPKFKVCSGTYGADLRIGGTVKDPTFNGSVSLADARFRVEGVPQDVEGIYVDARAEGKRFEVTRMTAEKGSLAATGYFTLDGVAISDWSFDLVLKELAITEFEDFYVVVSGNMSIRAEAVETIGLVPSIEGKLTVEEGEYYYSFGGGGGGGGGGLGPEAAPRWLMNLEVEVPRDFWVRGDDIDAELAGNLNVKKGAEGLLVLGDMRTLRGTFYIYNNDFRISRGEFRFTDVKSLKNVYIDLEATSRVLDERVDIAAKGNMENLDVTATSESGWSETQIFEALTLRRGAGTQGEASGKFFADEFLRSWGVALVNRFGNDVARELRLDQFGVEIGDGSQGNVLSATRVTFGKYVSDKVYLQYTQALGSLYGGTGKLTQRGLASPERQFQVEYRLSDRFSMEGEAGTVGGLGYFDVDLKFTYGY